MLEALVLTLREGVEAALVVGIIVTFLRQRQRSALLGWVWAGLAVAVAASVAGAWLLYRVALDEEAFEGVLYLASAVMVATMVAWMWRHARHVGGEVRGRLDAILGREGSAAAAGLFLFTFLMVFREGVETALFLSALSLTTRGLWAVFGAVVGLAAAVLFGVFFVRGSLRLDLGRFFRVTGVALLIFVVQLLFNAYHELSEAGWVPANETTMGVVGPLVRNEFFFFAAVVLLPVLLLVVPGRRGAAPAAGAAARLERAAALRQLRARWAAGALGLAILVVLTVGFTWSEPAPGLAPATPVAVVDGVVRLPVADLPAGGLRHFVAEVGGEPVRFLVVRLDDGTLKSAFDACLICGDKGYVRDGSGITCRHCHSVIYPPSIGTQGGCNPIPLPSRLAGGELIVAAADLAPAAPAAHHAHHGG